MKQTQTPDCWANWMGKMYFSGVVVDALSSSPVVLRCRPSRPLRLFFRSRWSHSLLTQTARSSLCICIRLYLCIMYVLVHIILIIRNSIIYMCYVGCGALRKFYTYFLPLSLQYTRRHCFSPFLPLSHFAGRRRLHCSGRMEDEDGDEQHGIIFFSPMVAPAEASRQCTDILLWLRY